MSFYLRSPDLAEEFEHVMAGDRDVDLGPLDTVSEWRLTQPLDVPGQPGEPADYVLIGEITDVELWQMEASDHIARLFAAIEHLVSTRGMLVLKRLL